MFPWRSGASAMVRSTQLAVSSTIRTGDCDSVQFPCKAVPDTNKSGRSSAALHSLSFGSKFEWGLSLVGKREGELNRQSNCIALWNGLQLFTREVTMSRRELHRIKLEVACLRLRRP